MSERRVICEQCDWVGPSEETRKAENPFVDGDVITACPRCLTIEQFVDCCDEPGCDKPVACGTPTPNGYRSTCGKHMPKELRDV